MATGVYNFDPSIMLNARRAKAAMMQGMGDFRIGFAGDSRAQSYGAAFGSAAAMATMDVQLAKLFKQLNYCETSYQAAFGDHGINWSLGQTIPNDWDNRVAISGFNVAGPYGFGGGYLFAPGPSGLYSFTPKDTTGAVINTNTCDIYYATYEGGGVFSKQVDTGAATNVSMNDTIAMRKTSLSALLGGHTYKANFVSSGAGGVYILGFEAYDNTRKSMHLLNLGWAGSKAQWWADASQAWQPASNWGVIDLDLAFISVMANDVLYGDRTLAQAQADLDSMVKQAQSADTDVVIVGYPPIKPNSTVYGYTYTYAQQQSLSDAMKDVAMNNSCAFISFFERDGMNFDTLWDLGWMVDDLHESDIGYAADLPAIANLIVAL